MAKQTEYEYTWTADYAAIIDGHSTPDGEGVLAEPGLTFKTVEPFDDPRAVPVVAAAPKADKPTTGSQLAPDPAAPIPEA